MRVLVVDDDAAVRASLSRALRLEGYEIEAAADGTTALTMISERHPDVIVLDVMLPPPDGLEVCRSLRARGDDVPVLMLTARDAVGDRVEGLDAGADDYLVKPFALAELLARLRALLRRAPIELGDEYGDGPAKLRFADLIVDTSGHQAWRGGRQLDLTRTEFSLLELFMRNPGHVLTRAVILDRVWGYDFATSSNSLEVFIGYLRRKTEAGGEPRLVQTVRGVGYVLRES